MIPSYRVSESEKISNLKQVKSLERLLDIKEHTSIETNEEFTKDEKINLKVQKLMNEMAKLNKAIKKDNSQSRQVIERVRTGTFTDNRQRDETEELFYDLPLVIPLEQFDQELSQESQEYIGKKLSRVASPINVLVEDDRRAKTDCTPEIKRKKGNIEELSEEANTELSFC